MGWVRIWVRVSSRFRSNWVIVKMRLVVSDFLLSHQVT